MVSGLRFILFLVFVFFWYVQHCNCGWLSVMDWVIIYYVMCSCLCEAFFYFYYNRIKVNIDRSREALSFYFLYFSIYVLISLPGWKEIYNLIYYYIFYWWSWLFEARICYINCFFLSINLYLCKINCSTANWGAVDFFRNSSYLN